MEIVVRPFKKSDWKSVSKIYGEGLETGMATFEIETLSWEAWHKKYHENCRLVATSNDVVVGFAVLSIISNRLVYRGVAEVSIYIAKKFRGKHIGDTLLKALIEESETSGFWTLQANIFSENKPSIQLHLKNGFRLVGVREKIGQLKGKWYDNQLLERRSKNIN